MGIFPHLFDSKLFNTSPLIYNMRLLSLPVQAYILGFPIHLYLPDEKTVNLQIDKLDQLGKDEYIRGRIEDNKTLLTNPSDLIISKENLIIGNEQDTLFENVFEYNSCDIIKYYNDSHIYYFTYPEFNSIINKKINHWSNLPLPTSVIHQIKARLLNSQVYNLPQSDTLSHLLEKVEDDKLYSEPTKSEPLCHQNLNRLFQTLQPQIPNINPNTSSTSLLGYMAGSLGNESARQTTSPSLLPNPGSVSNQLNNITSRVVSRWHSIDLSRINQLNSTGDILNLFIEGGFINELFDEDGDGDENEDDNDNDDDDDA
jgi:hypothetical protein